MSSRPSLSREPGLLWPALWRLALAGGAFIAVYGACNEFTSNRSGVGTLMFAWERHIPFVREMVVPYWSLDLFFIGAFFLCTSRAELSLLTRRLTAVILASGVCFLLFPLKLGFPRPDPEGWTAPLFRALYANDKPYNMAPSLHISLRSLLWVFYGRHLTGRTRSLTKLWFILIGLSTLLVWQHHLIDIATGFLMAWVIGACIPDPAQPGTRNPSPRLARRYAAGAAVCCLPGMVWPVLLWPGIACGIFALAYATGRSRLLGKENGTLSPAAEWTLLPVLLVAWCWQRRWLRRTPGWRELPGGLLLGRSLSPKESASLAGSDPLAVLDLTAEANAPAAFREQATYHNLPLLDLVPPASEHIREALGIIRREHAAGRKVYLHCRLGLQRSATIAAHWLVESGTCADLREAARHLRRLDPEIRLPQ